MIGSVNKRTFSLFDFSRTIFPRGRNGVPRSTSSNEPILTVLIGDHTDIIVLKYQSNQKKSNREITLLKAETLLFSKTIEFQILKVLLLVCMNSDESRILIL